MNHFAVDISSYNESDPTEELSSSNSRLSGPTKYIRFELAVQSNIQLLSYDSSAVAVDRTTLVELVTDWPQVQDQRKQEEP